MTTGSPRNRDAHAWVEAYDDEQRRWFAVESTPGRQYQTVRRTVENSDAEGLGTDATDDSQDRDRRGWIRGIVAWLSTVRASDPIILVLRFTQLPLFVMLTLGFVGKTPAIQQT